jgi:hypothetical protein
MNTQTTTQINQFLPLFLCSVSLIFYKLFFNSPLPLSVQQVCSASTFSIILLCFNLLCYSTLPFISLLHICSISYSASSPFPFLTVSFFFIQNSQPFTFCLIFFYTHLPDGSTSHFLRQNKDNCPSN